VGIDSAFPVNRNIHPVKKMPEQRNSPQLCFSHRMKIYRDRDINKHDVQIRRVIRTKNIRGIFRKLTALLDLIKNANRPEDKVCPDLFKCKNVFKPSFTPQKDIKERKKDEERYYSINKEQRTPEPLKRKKKVFDYILQNFGLFKC
jgi:hypothetical protein